MKVKRIFFSVIFSFIAVYITLATAYAQVASTSSQTSDTTTQVNYQLPYPGMLPDNPLYFLKAIRDQLTAFFLSKPLDKAQFDLLQSDKNVETSYLLVTTEVNKTDLAASSFTQGEADFSEAITQTQAAKKQGYDISDMSKNLDLSNQKHLEVLKEIEQQLGKSNDQGFQSEQDTMKEYAKQIKSLH